MFNSIPFPMRSKNYCAFQGTVHWHLLKDIRWCWELWHLSRKWIRASGLCCCVKWDHVTLWVTSTSNVWTLTTQSITDVMSNSLTFYCDQVKTLSTHSNNRSTTHNSLTCNKKCSQVSSILRIPVSFWCKLPSTSYSYQFRYMSVYPQLVRTVQQLVLLRWACVSWFKFVFVCQHLSVSCCIVSTPTTVLSSSLPLNSCHVTCNWTSL